MAVVIDELEVVPASSAPPSGTAAPTVEPPAGPGVAEQVAEVLRVRAARCERLRAD